MICKDHNPRVDYCPFCRVQQLENKFSRMEKAWRQELETWYAGNPGNGGKSLLAALNRRLGAVEAELAVCESFHKVAIQQRDAANRENIELKAELKKARS